MAGILADAVFVLHAAFVAWVVLGGLAVWRRPRLAWLHLPAVAWGVWLELSGAACPLTPLEQRLLRAAGEPGYEGGFVAHQLERLLYPAGLTPAHQWLLGAFVTVLNAAIYARLAWRRRAS